MEGRPNALIHLLVVLRLECIILLCQVAERDHDDRREYLCDRWIDMELLYKKLDEDIIQQQADHYQDKIPEQLHPSVQGGSCKNDISIQ